MVKFVQLQLEKHFERGTTKGGGTQVEKKKECLRKEKEEKKETLYGSDLFKRDSGDKNMRDPYFTINNQWVIRDFDDVLIKVM